MLYSEYLKNRHPYQELGSLLLLEQKHACLFYAPGKGKTYPTIDALLDVCKEKPKAKVLIMSTADAIRKMWQEEIVPQNILPENTVLVTFTQAIQPNTQQQLLSIKWDIIIVDECHKVKAHNTKISKLMFKLTSRAEYVWGLTGTPRGNTDVDIFCQFHNLNIGDWGCISYSKFVDTCCDVEQHFGPVYFKKPVGINHRYRAGWERNISMYTQRVDYTDDDGMPDLVTDVIKLPYEKTKEYKNAEEGIINIDEHATTMIKLAAITKMHQAVNGFLYLDDKKIHRFQYNIKLDWLKQNVDINEPTLIVYRHIADLEDIQTIFPNATEDINDFKRGHSNILLLQCSRCESFNLQNCRRIIFYTLDYSFIKYKQMLHRCWRQGQTQNTLIQILTFDNTIETKIWRAVSTKQQIASLFMSIKEG